MQYEIPNSVALPIGSNDTQLGFYRRILMEAARRVGLPLLEQADFALFILHLPVNSKEAEKLLDVRMQEKPPEQRILWNGKDPSPNDKTLEIQDWEFNKRRGKEFTIDLRDFEKEELKRRQIYYQLNGGVLGSMQEIPRDSDVIIIDLNIVYEQKQFNEAQAKETIKAQVDDAVNVYGAIEIKFNIVWSAGTGSVTNRVIMEGRKEGFVNIFLSISKAEASSQLRIDPPDPETGEIKTYDIFLTREKVKISGLSDNSLLKRSLSHELGHKFGIVSHYGIKFLGYDVGNWISDAIINTAIIMLRNGLVVKGIDWGRNLDTNNAQFRLHGRNNFGPTTCDLIRAGATRLSRKK